MYSKTLHAQASQVLLRCEQRGITLTTAESCTGGLIAGLFTEIPGSSAVFGQGVVTYSNAAKQSLLGVKSATLTHHGAVSRQAAQAMAEGALKRAMAGLSIAVTGIAGPGGGSKAKPVGLVYIAVSLKGHKTLVEKYLFKGSRSAIRLKAVGAALKLAKVSLARFA